MLGDAIEYPARGEDALTTLLVGGLLPVLATLLGVAGLALSVVLVGLAILPLALLPGLLLFGYYVAVLREVTAGEPDPPRFRNWRRLLADGVRFVAVSVAYAVPFVLLSGAFLAVVAGSGNAAGDATAETIATVGAVVTALLAAGALLVFAYWQPLALANVAREGRLKAAFDVETLREAGLSKAYALAWCLAVVVWLVGGALAGLLWAVVVGLFVGFYADVSRYYLYGRGLRRALSEEELERMESETLDDADDDRRSGANESFDGTTIPLIEGPRAFETRMGRLDDERGWSDWVSDEHR